MESIRLRTAESFFTDLLKEMSTDLSVNLCIHVITQVSLFLRYNPAFVPPFIRSGFLRALEFDMQVRFLPHLRILITCLDERPASVTANMIASIARFNNTRANAAKLIKLMATFLVHSGEHPEAVRIFTIFLDDPKPYFVHVQFISFVFRAHQACEAVRPLCISTLAKAVIAENAAVARSALAALCHLEIDISALPISDLIAGMRTGCLAAEGVELLARLEKLPPSRRLLACLLAVAPVAPMTIICLCTLASDPKGAELFLTGFSWLLELKLSDAFILLLTVCQQAAARQVVGQSPEFRAFLARLASEGTEEELDAVAPLVRRVQMDADFVRGLDAEGFFERYVPRCLQSQTPQLRESVVLLIDRMARITWVDGFGFFIESLPELFRKGGQPAQKGLVAALVCALLPQSRSHFAAADLIPVLLNFQVDRSKQQHKEQLLKYLSTIPASK
jgi:hypothetical protein